MKALCWQGTNTVAVERVPDPRILNPRDAIIRVTSTAICGSDLHLYGGKVPTLMKGDILGHEFMGEVVELGPAVKNLQIGDRVVVPFNIACGNCYFCERKMFSACDNSNPNPGLSEAGTGQACSALFGYTHMCGGYAGGQAEYVRVPFADVGPLVVPDDLSDEQVLFLSDIFPTGYMAAENCDIEPGHVVAVWGAGPVGQFAIRSAFMLGAERVFAIDRFPERLALAREAGAEVINYENEDVYEYLQEATGGQGPDACIDAVGMEAEGHTIDALMDSAKAIFRVQPDRAHALRQAIRSCRKGGVVSVPGVYIGLIDKFNFGMAFNKGLNFKMGQTHTHKYMRPLLERIQAGQIDPSFVISHRMTLDDAPEGYKMFRDKQQACTKIVMHLH
ncbi:MAG TPA: zinc-dependent alcohol dehydrogenase [Oligoflexus sp.]|uniref:zinc-dependent alcohol dehydrogenase n=1 Tax=Oligoflexus sp. TaxID=1971216 RepID=UPI002D80278F|nr:zinc-dependent alcohol dehydrogenase [Oligoflexus sp.]HET9237846.1 zinc-dependent alcohol dehydrogenase [Oligoflexus sp.]